MARNGKIITGLDIGTTKIGVVVAEPTESCTFRILGIGSAPAEGFKKGAVVDLEKTVDSIRQAIDDAEMVSGQKIESAFVGISGEHIRSINSRGVVAIGKNGGEIMAGDVDRALQAAKSISIPADREIIHILPQTFTVDEQGGIKDPVGFTGSRLEVDVHVVTGSATAIHNILKCIDKCGINIDELVLEPLASSYAVLQKDEMDLGCVVIDIGGGTTDIVVFQDGAIKHTAVISMGGKNVTSDLAIGLRTPLDKAEQLKCAHGSALSMRVDPAEMVLVPGVTGRESKQVSRSVLASIIEPRMEELFSLVARELKKSQVTEAPAAGVILTGGGSLLDGTAELAEQIFDLPAKPTAPHNYENSSEFNPGPAFATGIGLIHYSLYRQEAGVSKAKGKGMLRTVEKIKKWLNEYF
jgi:cell division protein FtsA